MQGENRQRMGRIKSISGYALGFALASALLSGCANPPFNDFKTYPDHPLFKLIQPGKNSLQRTLMREDIQYIEEGDTMTLIIPVDHYFLKDSAKINDICYDGLNNVVRLLKLYPKCPIYIASFTDSIGTSAHKQQLSEARAQEMLGFLWASNIPAHLLKAKGYGDLFAIGDNQYIHGAAYNRRIEIQWSKICDDSAQIMAAEMKR